MEKASVWMGMVIVREGDGVNVTWLYFHQAVSGKRGMALFWVRVS